VKRLFRKVDNKSADYDPHHPGTVRRCGYCCSCWCRAPSHQSCAVPVLHLGFHIMTLECLPQGSHATAELGVDAEYEYVLFLLLQRWQLHLRGVPHNRRHGRQGVHCGAQVRCLRRLCSLCQHIAGGYAVCASTWRYAGLAHGQLVVQRLA
jgi:hypothetical protein